mgnify:CR=1 FL=1
MRERPQAQLLFRNRPQLGQTVGLHDQEPDDECAEDHEFGMGHRRGGDGHTHEVAGPGQELVQENRQDHDERRAKEQALREREATENYAKQLIEENKKLQAQLHEGSKVFIEQGKTVAETDIAHIVDVAIGQPKSQDSVASSIGIFSIFKQR